MIKSVLISSIVCSLLIISCKKDDEISCTTCSSPLTEGFQVCQENDGNASVNGENTGTPYNIYLSGLEQAGASCGN